MARLSRLLGAVSLGIAVTAAVGAAVVAVEYNPVRKCARPPGRVGRQRPRHRQVQGRARRSCRRVHRTGHVRAHGSGPQKAGVLGSAPGPRAHRRPHPGRAHAGDDGQRHDVGGARDGARRRRRRRVGAGRPPALRAGGAGQRPALSGRPVRQATARPPASGTCARPASMPAATTCSPASTSSRPGPSRTAPRPSSIGDVDTGITAHPDLDSKMLPGYDFISDARPPPTTATVATPIRPIRATTSPRPRIPERQHERPVLRLQRQRRRRQRSPRTAAGTARRPPASWARPPTTASAWPARLRHASHRRRARWASAAATTPTSSRPPSGPAASP